MFTEKEMSDALKWLFDLFQPEDYEAYDEEEVGCAALCLPEVCMALRDKAETAYEYVVKTNIDRGFEYRGKELFMQRACLIYSDIWNVLRLLYHVPGRYSGSVGDFFYCGR